MNTLGGTLPLQEHNIHANQVNITLVRYTYYVEVELTCVSNYTISRTWFSSSNFTPKHKTIKRFNPCLRQCIPKAYVLYCMREMCGIQDLFNETLLVRY